MNVNCTKRLDYENVWALERERDRDLERESTRKLYIKSESVSEREMRDERERC